MKRLLSAIIVFCLSVSIFPSYAADSNNTVPTAYDEAAAIIQKLKILASSETSGNISRAAFIQAAVKAFDYDPIKAGGIQGVFKDVPVEHSAYPYINIAYSLNWISGQDGNMLIPDDEIRWEEAVKILVCALGYGQKAEYLGGYPSGFISIAHEINLLRNVNTTGASLRMNDAVILLFNTLNTKYLELRGVSVGAASFSEVGETVLERLYGIYNLKAQVVGNGITNVLSLEKPGRKQVVLKDYRDERLHYVQDTDGILRDKIGEQMKIYLKYDEEADSYNCFAAFSFNEDVGLFAGNKITGFTTSQNEFTFYEKENDDINDVSEKRIRYSYSNTITVVLNDIYESDNERVFKILSQEDTLYNLDKIKIIDIDSNGSCDVLVVYAYKNYVVDSVDLLQVNIKVRGSSQVLSLDSDKNTLYNSDGTLTSIKSIVQNSVISVFERASDDDDDLKNIVYISKNYIDGIIEEIALDKFSISTAGREMFFANEAIPWLSELEVGKEYRFFLDYIGYIAFSDKIESVNGFEGYFVIDKLHLNTQTLSKTLTLKAFDINRSKIVLAEASNQVKINDTTYKFSSVQEYEKVLSSLDGVRLVYCYFNGKGELKEIKTPSLNNSDFRYATGVKGPLNMTFKNGEMLFYQNVTANSAAHTVLLTSKTKIVSIPNDKTPDEERESVYGNIDAAFFKNDTKYDIDGYVLRSSGISADIVLNYVDANAIVPTSHLFVVDYVSSALNSEGMPCKKITGYQRGLPMSYVSREEYFTTINGEKLELMPGDTIIVQTNNLGDCTGVDVIYSYAKDELNVMNPTSYSSERRYMGIVYAVDGSCFSVVSNTMLSSLGGDMTGKLNSHTRVTYMYYFDPDERQGHRVRVASVVDLKPYLKYGMEASRVLLSSKYAMLNNLVIYKNK